MHGEIRRLIAPVYPVANDPKMTNLRSAQIYIYIYKNKVFEYKFVLDTRKQYFRKQKNKSLKNHPIMRKK